MKKILQFIFGKSEAQKWGELKDEVIGTDKRKDNFAKFLKRPTGGYPVYFESGTKSYGSKTIQPGYDQYGVWQEGSVHSWGSS